MKALKNTMLFHNVKIQVQILMIQLIYRRPDNGVKRTLLEPFLHHVTSDSQRFHLHIHVDPGVDDTSQFVNLFGDDELFVMIAD
jgi:hypothetical protein